MGFKWITKLLDQLNVLLAYIPKKRTVIQVLPTANVYIIFRRINEYSLPQYKGFQRSSGKRIIPFKRKYLLGVLISYMTLFH